MNLKRAHLAGIVGLFVVAAGLYWAKIEGQEAREHLTALEHAITADRRAVRTLEAEIAFLERPDRLEGAATTALGLAPIESDRRITLEALPGRLDATAPRPGADGSVLPTPAPTAAAAMPEPTGPVPGATPLPAGAGQ